MQELLPLLEVIRSLKDEQRVIVLAHLNDVSLDGIYRAITETLQTERIPIKKRVKLRSQLEPYKNEFRTLSGVSKGTPRMKKRALMQVGGGPMSYLLKEAVPFLLDILPPA